METIKKILKDIFTDNSGKSYELCHFLTVFILITITGMALTAGESVLHYAQAISLGVLPIVLKLVAKNLSDNEEER